MSDTPETDALTDADFKNIDEDMQCATLQAYNRLHDLCADLERERDEARRERDLLAETLSDLWHYQSLTGAAYDVIEKALSSLKGGLDE